MKRRVGKEGVGRVREQGWRGGSGWWMAGRHALLRPTRLISARPWPMAARAEARGLRGDSGEKGGGVPRLDARGGLGLVGGGVRRKEGLTRQSHLRKRRSGPEVGPRGEGMPARAPPEGRGSEAGEGRGPEAVLSQEGHL